MSCLPHRASPPNHCRYGSICPAMEDRSAAIRRREPQAGPWSTISIEYHSAPLTRSPCPLSQLFSRCALPDLADSPLTMHRLQASSMIRVLFNMPEAQIQCIPLRFRSISINLLNALIVHNLRAPIAIDRRHDQLDLLDRQMAADAHASA